MTRKVKPLIHLEQLEPRILLSDDSLLNITPNPDQNAILDKLSKVVQEVELLHINEQVEEQNSLEPAPSDSPNIDIHQPIFTLTKDNTTDEQSVDADLSVDNSGSTKVNGEITILLNDSDGDIESRVSTTKKDDTLQLYVNYNEIGIEETTFIGFRGFHWAKLVLKTRYVSALKAKDRKPIRLILDEYVEKV